MSVEIYNCPRIIAIKKLFHCLQFITLPSLSLHLHTNLKDIIHHYLFEENFFLW